MKDKQMIKITMKTKGRLKDVHEFEDIIIKSLPTGAQVRLKDVARVELGAESYSFFSRVSQKNAAIITVSQLPEANAIDLSNKVQKKLKELSKTFPKDIQYKIQHDETEFVRESIHEVISAVVLAVLLVSIVTYLFFRYRKSCIYSILCNSCFINWCLYLYAFIGFLNKSVNFVRVGSCRRFGCR